MASHDAVVIGAGLAGLTAARGLHTGGCDVVVLEARERVGGRTLDVELPGSRGERVEAGAQWLGPTHQRVAHLTAELGLATHPTYEEGDKLFELPTATVRYRGDTPTLNPVVLADVRQAMLRFDRLARRVPLEAPWRARNARAWDATTVDTWLRRTCTTPLGRIVFSVIFQAVWAAEPADVSLLHALFYTHAAGGLDVLVGTGGGAQQDRIVGGSQQLCTGLAAALGDRVRLAAPVRRIRWEADRVVVEPADGDAVAARRAVVALPPTLAGRLDYDPPLPAWRDQLTQRMPMGAVIKCHAFYDEPFWRYEGLCGQALSIPGPVRMVFDGSPPGGQPGVLVGFFAAAAARHWGRRPEAERRRAVSDVLARLFGPRAANPVAFVEHDWSTEEFTRGCYAGYCPPGVLTTYGPALRAPVGPLHWAGTETATVWPGYMEGAIQSGQRAAREVLGDRGRA